MILVIKNDITPEQFDHIINKIRELGFTPHISRGVKKTIIGLIGEQAEKYKEIFEAMEGVEHISEIEKPFKLASREFKEENTVVKVNEEVEIGGKKIVVIAGPCAVESREQIFTIAKLVKEYGAHLLRGGAFKPRTSPYTFQGLGKEALEYLKEVKRTLNIGVVSEVMNVQQVEMLVEYVDVLQIGARNVQNFDLLKEVGKVKTPVLLKRGMATTIKEWLMSAEYIMSQGNYNVILCERGIRTFEDSTRFTLDLNAIPVVKSLSHLPVIVDPSHGIGIRNFVPIMAKAAVVAGADGLIIEVHHKPEEAMSDGPQSIYPSQFNQLMIELRKIVDVIGREI
ncbi:MAG: 3-deoxy-7-phosphoheptulonate synthase [Elusimicrobiota bacterium]|nr:3-deoxy-7-phosphoheptulonate synthase [Endomicrobiia bacterium]MCX7910569.1 3-deoxy-7-phosphoheptulonate synthase [Endomicrobiia bacterium]MDW8164891.1 3-deoxy-7-phosphoheptulonate synthase [Elusimicrobiota bacterium]